MIEGAVYVRRSNLLGKLCTFPNATSTEVYRAVTVLRHLAPGACPGGHFQGAAGRLGLGLLTAFSPRAGGGLTYRKGVNVPVPPSLRIASRLRMIGQGRRFMSSARRHASFAPGRPPGGLALWKYQCFQQSDLPGQFPRTHHQLALPINTEKPRADTGAQIRWLLPRSDGYCPDPSKHL